MYRISGDGKSPIVETLDVTVGRIVSLARDISLFSRRIHTTTTTTHSFADDRRTRSFASALSSFVSSRSTAGNNCILRRMARDISRPRYLSPRRDCEYQRNTRVMCASIFCGENSRERKRAFCTKGEPTAKVRVTRVELVLTNSTSRGVN